MTFTRLLFRNLRFHWRGNFAVFLGVAVGTAVLTGALLVGDSLRGSLHDLALRQLGWVQDALITGRFFREELGQEADAGLAGRFCPALVLQGSAGAAPGRRVGRVAVYGVDFRFWGHVGWMPSTSIQFWNSTPNGVFLNSTLAADLSVTSGDTVTLYLQKASNVPRESLLGRRDASEVLDELRLTVTGVFPEHLRQQL
jgi:putative ABC transport system permease protein